MSPLYFKKPLCGFLPSADRLHRLISIAFDTVLPQASIISRVKIPRVTLFTGLTFLVVLMDMVRDTTPGIALESFRFLRASGISGEWNLQGVYNYVVFYPLPPKP